MAAKVALKQRIRQGDVDVGVRVSIGFERSQVENLLSQGSYDFLYLDGQHSAYSEEGLVKLCLMAQEDGGDRLPGSAQVAKIMGRFYYNPADSIHGGNR